MITIGPAPDDACGHRHPQTGQEVNRAADRLVRDPAVDHQGEDRRDRDRDRRDSHVDEGVLQSPQLAGPEPATATGSKAGNSSRPGP
jgi:hypothetical protein